MNANTSHPPVVFWTLLAIFGALLLHTLYRAMVPGSAERDEDSMRRRAPHLYWALQVLAIALLVAGMVSVHSELRAGTPSPLVRQHWLALGALALILPAVGFYLLRALVTGRFASRDPDAVVLRAERPYRYWSRVTVFALVLALCGVALWLTLARMGVR